MIDRPPPAADADRGRRIGGDARRPRRRERLRAPTRSAGCRRAARIEVLDDYPYWVGKKYGYFGDIETTLEPGPSDATATVKLVDQNQADIGYPSPGVFSLGAGAGHPARLGLRDGRRRRVRLRLPQGRGAGRHQGHRGQDHRARQRRLAVDRRPDAEGGGRRHHHGEIRRCRLADLGHGGHVRARATRRSRGKACAPSGRARASTSTTSSAAISRSCRRTASSSARRTSTMRRSATVYARYLKGWAAGLEFGHLNPRAATQIVMEQFPGLVVADDAGGRDRVDDAARQRLSRPLGRARASGASTSCRIVAALLRHRPRDRPDHRRLQGSRTW